MAFKNPVSATNSKAESFEKKVEALKNEMHFVKKPGWKGSKSPQEKLFEFAAAYHEQREKSKASDVKLCEKYGWKQVFSSDNETKLFKDGKHLVIALNGFTVYKGATCVRSRSLLSELSKFLLDNSK